MAYVNSILNCSAIQWETTNYKLLPFWLIKKYYVINQSKCIPYKFELSSAQPKPTTSSSFQKYHRKPGNENINTVLNYTSQPAGSLSQNTNSFTHHLHSKNRSIAGDFYLIRPSQGIA